MIDNIKVTGYENSLFIIKPDAYQYKNRILNELLNIFRLVELEDVILTEHFLGELYKNEDDVFKNMNIEYMKNKKATIGIVSGPDCKKRLFEICGEDFRAERCKPDTIRHKFNICPEPIVLNGQEFYVNAIHRASPEDADGEIELYKKEYVYARLTDKGNEEKQIDGKE